MTRWTEALSDAVPANGAGVALSSDGTRLAYAEGSGTPGMPSPTGNPARLWLRRLDQFEAAPITGTDGGLRPFFAPDAQSLAYFTAPLGELERVPATGGTPVTLCQGAGFYGGTWSDDGTIVFSGLGGLKRVAASGGACESLTKVDANEGEAHRWPQFLPGGRAILFTIGSQRGFDSAQIAALDLKTGSRTVVVKGGTVGRYVPSGHLVYVRAGTLFAVPFDVQRLVVTGVEMPVVESVYYNPGGGFADYAFSDSGLLIYMAETRGAAARPLEWVDRKGNRQAAAESQAYSSVRVSPDGLHMAVSYGLLGGSDIWTYEFARGAWKRLTAVGNNLSAVWTPDGRRIAFYPSVREPTGVYWAPSDGDHSERLLPGGEAVPNSWTQDGRTLLYTERFGGKTRIWAVSVNGAPTASGAKGKPRLLSPESSSNESDAQVSPDGLWVAYTSDESGKNQVYVRPFSGPGGAVLISIESGQEPRWSRDGKELFYRDARKSRLMAVGVPAGPTLRPNSPQALFELRNSVWDVAPNGRFLVMKDSGSIPNRTNLEVVDNWFEELRRKVPAGKGSASRRTGF